MTYDEIMLGSSSTSLRSAIDSFRSNLSSPCEASITHISSIRLQTVADSVRNAVDSFLVTISLYTFKQKLYINYTILYTYITYLDDWLRHAQPSVYSKAF